MPAEPITVELRPVPPPPTYLARLATNSLIAGAPSADWWAKQAVDVQFRFATAVRAGIAANETAQQIVARVRGVMDVAARNAYALVRTSVQQVAADARRETFQRNADVIAGIKHVSTFDERTTDVCIAYGSDSATEDGAEYDLDYSPINGTKLPYVNDGHAGVPRHWGCRSAEVALTKSWTDLGYPELEEGYPKFVPAESGDEWLRGQTREVQDELLGAGRAELWRSGKFTLTQLLDAQTGNALSVDALRAKYGGVAVAEPPIETVIELTAARAPAVARESAVAYVVEQGRAEGGNIEYGYAVKPDGTPLFYHRGSVGAFPMTPEENLALRDNPGSLLVHNHPASSSLSDGDLYVARERGMSGIVAAGNDGESLYEARFGQNTGTEYDVVRAHQLANGDVHSLLDNDVFWGRVRVEDANSAHWHLVNRIAARLARYEYIAQLSDTTQGSVNRVVGHLASVLGVDASEDAVISEIVRRARVAP